MDSSVKQYVGQRAELLANLVLTRRKDVEIYSFGPRQDLGIDMLVRVLRPVMEEQFYPSFGVEVMGTSEPLADEEAATRYANRHWKYRPSKGLLLFPIIILLFSVEGDVGYYSWLMEPRVNKDHGPSLTRLSPLDMRKIGKKSVDEIIDRVREWFRAMAGILVKPAPTK